MQLHLAVAKKSLNSACYFHQNKYTFNLFCFETLFLTAKEAVQQSIRLTCVFVCANLEILHLKGSLANQSTVLD